MKVQIYYTIFEKKRNKNLFDYKIKHSVSENVIKILICMNKKLYLIFIMENL